MTFNLDLKSELRGLIAQIPENMVTTPRHLAVALGDPISYRAVSEILKEEMIKKKPRVMDKKPTDLEVFSDFASEKPLIRLTEQQIFMANKISSEDGFHLVRKIGGVDAAYHGNSAFAVCVVIDEEFNIVDSESEATKVKFPYIPGYLTFREAPAIIAAAKKVKGFDVLLVNGHGIAHPRKCGLASYVGLELNLPTIGVTKRLLVGQLGARLQGWRPLLYSGRIIGAQLKTKQCSPIYVSVGHKISLKSSIKIVREMMSLNRMPEPLRLAHIEARKQIET